MSSVNDVNAVDLERVPFTKVHQANLEGIAQLCEDQRKIRHVAYFEPQLFHEFCKGSNLFFLYFDRIYDSCRGCSLRI